MDEPQRIADDPSSEFPSEDDSVSILPAASFVVSGVTPEAPLTARPACGFADGQALGDYLRRHRALRNVSLDSLAERTKVIASRLEALERGDLRRWPHGIYRRAIVRSYASAVGLDPDEIVQEFVRLFPEPDPFAPPDGHDERRRRAVKRLRAVAVQVGARFTRLVSPARVPIRLPARPIVPVMALVIGYIVGSGGSVAERPLRFGREAVVGLIEAIFDTEPTARGTARSVAGTSGLGQLQAADATQPDITLVMTQPAERQQPVDPTQPVHGAKPVPPAPVKAAPSEPLLVVTSMPSGARVTVNGIGWGATPLTIRHLPPGPKRIRVTKEGYHSAERAVIFPNRGRATVRVQLPSRDSDGGGNGPAVAAGMRGRTPS